MLTLMKILKFFSFLNSIFSTNKACNYSIKKRINNCYKEQNVIILTLIPELCAPEIMTAKQSQTTERAWLHPVKLRPMRQTAGPNMATIANDFRIVPRDKMSLLDSPSAIHAMGMEKNSSNKYGRADKNPF